LKRIKPTTRNRFAVLYPRMPSPTFGGQAGGHAPSFSPVIKNGGEDETPSGLSPKLRLRMGPSAYEPLPVRPCGTRPSQREQPPLQRMPAS
jgi:hypothetical protein